MFRGFIVVGVTFGVGYSLGYMKGQDHTRELKVFLQDLRDSEETKAFLVELREALKNLPKESDEEEKSATEADVVSSAIETPEDPIMSTPNVPPTGE